MIRTQKSEKQTNVEDGELCQVRNNSSIFLAVLVHVFVQSVPTWYYLERGSFQFVQQIQVHATLYRLKCGILGWLYMSAYS